jgi:general secretion pathway protein D
MMSGPAHRAGRAAFALATTLASGIWLASPALPAAGAATVRVVPAPSTIGIGATVTVFVRIERARNVASVPFTIYFDPAILEFVGGSAREGNFLNRNGAATTFIAVPGPASRGGGVVVGLSRLGAARGVQGKGLLCRLTFRARAPGIAPVGFARATVLDPAAQRLEAVFKGTSIRVRPAP